MSNFVASQSNYTGTEAIEIHNRVDQESLRSRIVSLVLNHLFPQRICEAPDVGLHFFELGLIGHEEFEIGWVLSHQRVHKQVLDIENFGAEVLPNCAVPLACRHGYIDIKHRDVRWLQRRRIWVKDRLAVDRLQD